MPQQYTSAIASSMQENNILDESCFIQQNIDMYLVHNEHYHHLSSESAALEEFDLVSQQHKAMENFHSAPIHLKPQINVQKQTESGNAVFVFHHNEYEQMAEENCSNTSTTSPIIYGTLNGKSPLSPQSTVSFTNQLEHQGTTTSSKEHIAKPTTTPSSSQRPETNTICTKDDNVCMRRIRHDQDMYTPRWIRGAGAMREGLCELCQPPQWLKIKQSAYWYHMNFQHGISANTGKPYEDPIDLKRDLDWGTGLYQGSQVIATKGQCQKCCKWIVLSQQKEDSYSRAITMTKSTETLQIKELSQWWKHAQKCYKSNNPYQKPAKH